MSRVGMIGRLREGSLLGRAGRDVTYLSAGSAIAQVVLLAAQAVLARQYDTEDFGTFSIAVAVGSLIAVVATLRYEMAVPLAADEDEADALVGLCLLTSTVTTAAMCAGLAWWWWSPAGVAARSRPEPVWGMGLSLWLVPIVAWVVAAYTAVRMLEGRRNRFGVVGKATVSGAVAQAVGQIGAGIAGAAAAGLGGLGLTAGYVLGRLVNTAGMATDARRVLRRPRVPLRPLMGRWRRMPLLGMLPALLNGLTVGAVAPLVGWLFGVGFAGLFGFATRLLAAPAALLGQAVAGVFYPAMARLDRGGADPAPHLARLTAALTAVSLPVFVPVLLLGPELFVLCFGSRWRDAGVIAALLAPWLAASFVSSPLSTYATVKDRLGRLFIVSFVEMSLRAAGLAVGYLRDDPMLGVGLYSAAGVLICGYFIAWTLRLGRAPIGGVLRQSRAVLGTAAAVLVVSTLARLAWPGGISLGVAAVLCLVLAAVSARRLHALVVLGRPR